MTCPHDDAVRAALAADRLDDTLRAHVAACPACHETVEVSRYLRQVATATRAPALPSAGQLWWRSRIIHRLVERDRRAERAVRPALIGQALGGVAGLVGVLLALGMGTLLPAGTRAVDWLTGDGVGVALAVFGLAPLALAAVLLAALWRDGA